MRGRTSQQTIIKLAKFNAVVCFLCEHHIRIKPVLVGATTARKQLFGKSRQNISSNLSEQVLGFGSKSRQRLRI